MRFGTILLLLFAYTAYRATTLWPAHRWVAALLTLPFFALMIGWQFAYRYFPQILDTGWFQVLAWSGSVALAFWATLMIIALPVDLIHLVSKILKGFGLFSEVSNPERRTFLSQGMRVGLLGLSGGIVSLGLFQTLRGPRIKEVTLSIPDLPDSLDGFRIAQISDLHVGPTIRKGYVEDVVRKTNSTLPDLIAITGDLADGLPELMRAHIEPLKDLKSKLGTFYVTGNHEYYWGGEKWMEEGRKMGFVPLLNENRILDIGGSRILLAGVTDTSAEEFIKHHRTDPQKAIQSAQSTSLKILLAHRPNSCFEAEAAGFDLQLSGHTHAGQFFPWSLFFPFVYSYYRGLNRHKKMWLYVNAGTGYWGPAHRFTIPSEITLIRLRTGF